ncbi:TM2 domain-containing protein [Mycoplasma phocoenae]|uniref:TM2 domain-containing protein n=1 Tax=Mycoplasma phocoenae TaxID=754517 RepID=A0A858U7R1_9MOLU|nr:TM2 domain-containing protein [Mycoplasma phocoenae]QJG66766.1 TM2 domain-containing protein [Mycoplasma phocoenae]
MNKKRCLLKNRWMQVMLLNAFLGFLGVDRFYTKKYYLGVAKFLSLGGLFIWVIIDCILLMFEKYKDGNDNYIKY